ncbi:MAG TPA: GMC family oxidoreductase N-terminal domain-containing protein [Actinomycetaceae bacterium]|nr:GMC family oxidoreductase N-terminal domain-containing protein [Actinomycetaceae bacterium]
MIDQYDYIIIGAGAAGATLAHELSTRTNKSILVLESGGKDNDPWIHIPKGFAFLVGGKKHSFYYDTKPLRQSGQPDRWQRGRVDGGSTSVNGMQYDRAGKTYWNTVADIADDQWSWDKVLETYKSFEDYDLGASPTRGEGGPLGIMTKRDPEPLNDAVVEAAGAFGLPWTDDLNEHDGERISFIPNTVRKGLRQNTAVAFLDPALKRPHVTRLNHAHAVRIQFDGKRAVAVEALVKNHRRLFYATEEIILSAGPIETPMLLERSGIGQGEVLHKLGVTPVVENPHVGEHATEQRFFNYQWRIKEQMGYNQKLSSKVRQLLTGAKYLLTREGVIGTGGYDLGGFVKSNPGEVTPDLFIMFSPFALDYEANGYAIHADPGLSGTGYLVSPTTESSIHATSMDPFAPPIIDVRYLEEQWEQEAQRRGLEIVREIAAKHPLADLITEEEAPGPEVRTTEEVLAHSWLSGNAFHAVATARMGSGDDSVLDPSLRVRGVEALRVADASVLPKEPGNTMAPSMLVGAHAARIITGKY